MAGIIRREQFTSGGSFSFADLEQQGRTLLQRAQTQAQETIRQAEQQAQKLVQQQKQAAYQAGLAEGRAAGLKQIRAEAHAQVAEEARQQIADLVATLTTALAEFERNKRTLLAAAESGLIELALAIARRVCKTAAGCSNAAAQANARYLLDMVQHHADAELRVHPDEYAGMQELAAELLARTEELGHVKIVAEPTVPRGGCRLTTRDGQIDAGLKTQLDRIAATLLPRDEAVRSELAGEV
jgi:flagellar assembly protein FliH